jgi:hypothetical protein
VVGFITWARKGAIAASVSGDPARTLVMFEGSPSAYIARTVRAAWSGPTTGRRASTDPSDPLRTATVAAAAGAR